MIQDWHTGEIGDRGGAVRTVLCWPVRAPSVSRPHVAKVPPSGDRFGLRFARTRRPASAPAAASETSPNPCLLGAQTGRSLTETTSISSGSNIADNIRGGRRREAAPSLKTRSGQDNRRWHRTEAG